MLSTINDLLATKKIPALDDLKMGALLHYIFHTAPYPLRLEVAEVVYRDNYDHPKAFDLFLASSLPIIERAAQRYARRIAVYPSDWMLELMYDGGVKAVISWFQRRTIPNPSVFRKVFFTCIRQGAIHNCFYSRKENTGLLTVDDLSTIRTPVTPNTTVADIATREILDQILALPELRPSEREVLQCIATLGPDVALKQIVLNGVKTRINRLTRLDSRAIAKALNIAPSQVQGRLSGARATIRRVFNDDGKLFFTR